MQRRSPPPLTPKPNVDLLHVAPAFFCFAVALPSQRICFASICFNHFKANKILDIGDVWLLLNHVCFVCFLTLAALAALVMVMPSCMKTLLKANADQGSLSPFQIFSTKRTMFLSSDIFLKRCCILEETSLSLKDPDSFVRLNELLILKIRNSEKEKTG